MKRLTEEHALKLYSYLKDSINPKDVLIQVAFETGCRVGELLLMGPKLLNENRLRVIPLKGSKPREVIISNNLRLKLEKLPSDLLKDLWIRFMVETVQPESQRRSISRRFKAICLKLFDKGHNIHMLRHTAISRLYDKTEDLLLVQEWAGHRAVTSTVKYLLAKRAEEANKVMALILEG